MRSEEPELRDGSLTTLVNCRETILYFYLVLLRYLSWKHCEMLCCARGLWSVKKGDLGQRWGHEILEKLQQHTTSLTVQKLRTRRLQCSTKEAVKVFLIGNFLVSLKVKTMLPWTWKILWKVLSLTSPSSK